MSIDKNQSSDSQNTDVNQNSDKSQDVNTDHKSGTPIPYERFAEVNARKNALEAELKTMREAQQKADNDRKELELKARNDYEGLTQMEKEKTAKAITAAKQQIASAYLSQLGTKHNIIDHSDIKLFTAEIEFDDSFNIANADNIAKAFEKEFVTKKPYLFKQPDGKPVPRTDNSPIKKINASDNGEMTTADKFKQGITEALAKRK